MSLYSLIGFAAAAAVAGFTVRRFNEQAGRNIAIAGAAFMLLAIIAHISGILDELNGLALDGGIGQDAVKLVLKAIGIAYLTSLTASICRDMDENTLAAGCELTGRIMLLTLALPIIRSIAKMLIELVNTNMQ